MAWTPPDNYAPISDHKLREILAQTRLVPRSTAYRIYQVVAYRKEPVLADSQEHHDLSFEEFTPAQARSAFENRWVPARWITRFMMIALSDGEDFFPKGED